MKKDLSKYLNIIKEKRVNSIAVELTLVAMLKHIGTTILPWSRIIINSQS